MRSRSKRQTHFDRLVEDGAQRAVRPSCPASEAINLNRQTGVQREKGLSLQPPDVDRGRRTGVNSVVSIRAACEGPTSTPLRQHSLVGDRGRANHPLVRPVQQGSRTQGFYGRKPWKKPNSAVIIAAPSPAKEGLRRPFRKLPQDRSLKLTASPPHSRPAIATTVRGSACSEAPAF